MINILESTRFRNFTLMLLKADETIWVYLKYADSESLQQFWESEAVSMDEARKIRRQIIKRLDTLPLDQATEFFPKNWQYWGGGIPEPLFEFIRELSP